MGRKEKLDLSDLARLIQDNDIELKKEVAEAIHQDENIANNRLFVWNFERADLEEFVRYFTIFKNRTVNASTRNELNNHLFRKMSSMINEGYIPIECMLYASKIINAKLSNDFELRELMADRIAAVYRVKHDETVDVLNNILNLWNWSPQLKVVISAIGKIGDNDMLLDMIEWKYGMDDNMKDTVFRSFMTNKNEANMERAIRMVMGLHKGIEVDAKIGRIFRKEFIGFGQIGIKVFKKYCDNPGISSEANRVFRQIKIDNNIEGKEGFVNDEYWNQLAKNSRTDDNAYDEFLEYCHNQHTENSLFISRFSRPDIVDDYLKNIVTDTSYRDNSRNTALISIAFFSTSGYRSAHGLIRSLEGIPEIRDGVLAARLIMGDDHAADDIASIMTQAPEYKLRLLYGAMKNAGIAKNSNCISPVQNALFDKFIKNFSNKEMDKISNLLSNIRSFWGQNMFSLLSEKFLNMMNQILEHYAEGNVVLDDDMIISIMEISGHRYNNSYENVLFNIYNNIENGRVKNYIFTVFKSRNIQPPK